ncbi:hypothetical protein MLD38_000218 [Melastoma candidum]|uniref:Uncharacterized protein n=1 Tax=Melastoma candidum TaxID=119954 RepID=A0ACB9S9T7_9MYRT|nr:hypothetical protein MLD38_000218 [Melastoma candidum]
MVEYDDLFTPLSPLAEDIPSNIEVRTVVPAENISEKGSTEEVNGNDRAATSQEANLASNEQISNVGEFLSFSCFRLLSSSSSSSSSSSVGLGWLPSRVIYKSLKSHSFPPPSTTSIWVKEEEEEEEAARFLQHPFLS